jgi:hypothetical protein
LAILILSCLVWTSSSGQVAPPAVNPQATGSSAAGAALSGANKNLSSSQKKAKARQDSALSAANRYVQPGKVRKPNGKTSPQETGKEVPRLARVDTAERPDPQRFVLSLDHGSCKGIILIPVADDSVNVPPVKAFLPSHPAPPPPRIPFLQVHGNIMYNLNYYSLIDTPYDERNIYQHTIQTWLDVLIKGEYPFRIFLTNHFSNSSLFRNYSDLNFSYNNSGFNQQVKDQLRRTYLQSLPSQKVLDSLQRVLNGDWQKIKGLDQWEKNPALIQKMVETREASMKKGSSSGQDSSSATSGIKEKKEGLDSVYAGKKKEADSIRAEIVRVQRLLQTVRQSSQADVNKNLSDIQQLENPAQLEKKLPGMGIGDSSLPKGYKTLMAVKSFNVGRTVVNYSELSAKDISVNGVQAEYNPGYYYAFASGAIDYRFRDFLIQQPNEPHQYLNIFRFGRGLKDGNSVILTYFTGHRQLYTAATTDTATTQVPSSSLMGLTLEGNYHLTKNILFTGEIGKSSSPSYTGDTSKGSSQGSQLFSINDRSNEAWSTKVSAVFPATDTKIRAAYKHLAMNYQSFSIFTDGSAQSAWSVNVDQLLFKKQLDIAVGANTNDFSNPLLGQEYSSTTVFKSIQATLRRRNWPIISLGYFPSEQITKMGSGQYQENLFYTFTGNMTDSYRWRRLLMNTTVVYTQFYNKPADSGFAYYNTRNLLVSQTVFLNKFTLQMNASAAANQSYDLYTLEGKVQHTITRWLTAGVGVKYNVQTVYNIDQFGYSAQATLKLNHLGQIQFNAEKGFIPGMNKQLVPDNTGRLTYLKTF